MRTVENNLRAASHAHRRHMATFIQYIIIIGGLSGVSIVSLLPRLSSLLSSPSMFSIALVAFFALQKIGRAVPLTTPVAFYSPLPGGGQRACSPSHLSIPMV